MKLLLIKNAKLVNEGEIYQANLIVKNGLIDSIHRDTIPEHTEAEVIDARGLYLLPGVIDDQVHFREPGASPTRAIWLANQQRLLQVVLQVLWKCPTPIPKPSPSKNWKKNLSWPKINRWLISLST